MNFVGTLLLVITGIVIVVAVSLRYLRQTSGSIRDDNPEGDLGRAAPAGPAASALGNHHSTAGNDHGSAAPATRPDEDIPQEIGAPSSGPAVDPGPFPAREPPVSARDEQRETVTPPEPVEAATAADPPTTDSGASVADESDRLKDATATDAVPPRTMIPAAPQVAPIVGGEKCLPETDGAIVVVGASSEDAATTEAAPPPVVPTSAVLTDDVVAVPADKESPIGGALPTEIAQGETVDLSDFATYNPGDSSSHAHTGEEHNIPPPRAKRPTTHRDRRGRRRVVAPPPAPVEAARAARPPAEARLRLSLHPIRRTAKLALVLTRPEGFPSQITLATNKEAVSAFDEHRYDDIQLSWTPDLLEDELRVDCAEGFQWLRSARQVQIFAPDENEPDLVAISAARPGVAHTIVCRNTDVADVCGIAASTGSPDLHTHARFRGIPDGWAVLGGYVPRHAAVPSPVLGLRPLDPGNTIFIELDGGLAIRHTVFAEGHPPKIRIDPLPGGTAVRIGGQTAERNAEGAWEAPGWNEPGRHLIDVAPGPSLSYEIVADPAESAGWPFWDAHSGRFTLASAPWARAQICGARVAGPNGQGVLAVESRLTLALGAQRGAMPLRYRTDVGVSVGLVAEPPAFLIVGLGQRHRQGKVLWLGAGSTAENMLGFDRSWADAVRTAASRQLVVEVGDPTGEIAWQTAVSRARRMKRARR
jgi:hypothetical protein